MTSWLKYVAAALAVHASGAQAHHAMDYEAPVTALQGLLSGLGHPVIGLDHFLFIAGAGVLAARYARGWWLPLHFVVASTFSVAVRYLGVGAGPGELPVALSLIVLAALLLAARNAGQGATALVFLGAGTLHGYALAEAVIGAEPTPLVAYLIGLTTIQCAVALIAWRAALWAAAHRPRLPLQKLAGTVVGVAGLVFAGMAAL